MARRGGIVGTLREAAEERLGVALMDREELAHLQEAVQDGRYAALQAERLAYMVLNQATWTGQDIDHKSRINMAKEAREVWAKDAHAGAANDLMNDFTFGRGVPKPRFKDELAQEVIDEAWDDPDNQLILTSYQAQLALGTDLNLQSNVFLLMFDDGGDGKVKLALLEHDTVQDVVRDEDNRLRILYYKTEQLRREWDWQNDRLKTDPQQKAKVMYYEHWRGPSVVEESGGRVPRPPQDKRGEGQVYHVAINRSSEMAFGMPTMRRMLRWFSAYNEFMASRVDIMKAAAAFLMKRKVQGGENAVLKAAQQTLSRSGPLGAAGLDAGPTGGPTPVGSTLVENQAVTHEPFSIPTNAPQAQQDGDMLQGMIATGSRFPKHYYGGDPGSLAGATAVELPVLKAVESRQEVWEGVYRWFIDRVIERAVDAGRIPPELSPEEITEARERRLEQRIERMAPRHKPARGESFVAYRERLLRLAEAHEEQAEDEATTQRDLSYEFAMPNPLRRAMGELIGAVGDIAKTFDPNGTNLELSRQLLAIALSQGLEIEDAAEMVQAIFPEGYVDPALAAYQQQAAPAPGAGGGAVGADGDVHTEDNPYGAPMNSTLPEDVEEAAHTFESVPGPLKASSRRRARNLDELWQAEVDEVVLAELEEVERRLAVGASVNGNGKPH